MLIERPLSTEKAIEQLFDVASGFEYQEQLSSLIVDEIESLSNLLKSKIDSFVALERINPKRYGNLYEEVVNP